MPARKASPFSIRRIPEQNPARYCYAPDAASRRAETPLDSNNHALDALRYLIASIDERKLRRKPKLADPEAAKAEEKKKKPWLRYDNEALWKPIW